MPKNRRSATKENAGKALIPQDEEERLRHLADLDILDGNPEAALDRITLLAKTFFGVHVCAISLIGQDQQNLKSIAGVAWADTSREDAFCAHTILQDQPLVVPDATLDPRFRENALVTGRPGIRFYAGVPLNTRPGSKIGALCLIDTKPRGDWSDMRSAMLTEMARMVCHEIELRSLRKRQRELLQRNEELLRRLYEYGDNDECTQAEAE